MTAKVDFEIAHQPENCIDLDVIETKHSQENCSSFDETDSCESHFGGIRKSGHRNVPFLR